MSTTAEALFDSPSVERKETREVFSVSYQINYAELNFGRELGRGGFGVVHQGTWRKHTEVAIKQLLSDDISHEAKEEFETEAQVMARLRSPHIVQFYGYCLSPRHCIVMEYMPNGSLFSVLRNTKQPLDWTVRIRIAVDMACGVAFLHQEHIVHRDIKSLNVLLDKSYGARLTDFGLSKVKTETKSQSMATRTSKDAVGTVAWMAPELFKRKSVYTQKSDIYSLGITFWELATRKIPYSTDAQEAIPAFVQQGEREDIPTDCPQKLASLIAACWESSPDKRPDADAVVTYLKSEQTNFAQFLPLLATHRSSEYQSNLHSTPTATASYQGNFHSKPLKPPKPSLSNFNNSKPESPGLVVKGNSFEQRNPHQSSSPVSTSEFKTSMDLGEAVKQIKASGFKVKINVSFIETIKQNNSEEFFRLLDLSMGSSDERVIDEIDKECEGSALYWAAAFGHLHFIVPLLRAGLDVNKPDKYGSTPVWIAAKNDHSEVIIALHAAGANVDTPNKLCQTPAWVAARNGHAAVIRALHTTGANMNNKDKNGEAPIHCAITFIGCNALGIKDKNKKDETPACAIERGLEVINALKTAGANMDIQDNRGRTPLNIAADYPVEGRVIAALKAAGANVNIPDAAGKTPVHIAAEKSRGREVVTALIAAGANVNTPDKHGQTPIYVAAANRLQYLEGELIINVLIKAGANVNMPDEDGRTPLHRAVADDNIKGMIALINAGADLNALDKHGRTPLFIAAQVGKSEESVKILLNAGADASIKTKWGTALEYAEQQGKEYWHKHIASLLRQHYQGQIELERRQREAANPPKSVSSKLKGIFKS